MIDPIITVKVILFVGMLLLGQTLSNMLREHSSNTSNLDNPF